MTATDPTRLTRKDALRLLAAAAGAVAAPAAFAQDSGHAGHGAGGMAAAPGESPSTEAYREAATKMHVAMDITYTGNADVDFVRGMIAHHQGAIDMAGIVLEYGSDPDIRQLANDVIVAQEQEIVFMKAWLDANGG